MSLLFLILRRSDPGAASIPATVALPRGEREAAPVGDHPRGPREAAQPKAGVLPQVVLEAGRPRGPAVVASVNPNAPLPRGARAVAGPQPGAPKGPREGTRPPLTALSSGVYSPLLLFTLAAPTPVPARVIGASPPDVPDPGFVPQGAVAVDATAAVFALTSPAVVAEVGALATAPTEALTSPVVTAEVGALATAPTMALTSPAVTAEVGALATAGAVALTSPAVVAEVGALATAASAALTVVAPTASVGALATAASQALTTPAVAVEVGALAAAPTAALSVATPTVEVGALATTASASMTAVDAVATVSGSTTVDVTPAVFTVSAVNAVAEVVPLPAASTGSTGGGSASGGFGISRIGYPMHKRPGAKRAPVQQPEPQEVEAAPAVARWVACDAVVELSIPAFVARSPIVLIAPPKVLEVAADDAPAEVVAEQPQAPTPLPQPTARQVRVERAHPPEVYRPAPKPIEVEAQPVITATRVAVPTLEVSVNATPAVLQLSVPSVNIQVVTHPTAWLPKQAAHYPFTATGPARDAARIERAQLNDARGRARLTERDAYLASRPRRRAA